MARRKTQREGAGPGVPAVDPEAVKRTHLFPVRHHSPRASAALHAFLEGVRPKLVLVEGPADASGLIDVITDEGTVPPVAVLAYRTDEVADSSVWPMAAYSPEYVALRWARERGVPARFIDLLAGQAIAAHAHAHTHEDEHVPVHAQVDFYDWCAGAFGQRSFEEFWEAFFEAPGYGPGRYRQALLAYAEAAHEGEGRPYDRARDAVMAGHISAAVAGGVAPEEIAVVLGAAHAVTLQAGDVDAEKAGTLPAPVPCALTLIPYSFPRLSEQLGYGAGNHAPQYYQRAHDAGCDFTRATLEVLVDFTDQLRVRGFAVSLADTIEAYRLAVTLAGMRGKSAPGLDEVREATVATLCRGDATHVDGLLWPSVIGRRLGRVAQRIGRNSLQEEFWREVRARKLAEDDEEVEITLQLRDEQAVGTSTFLHRLRIAGVPYAGYEGTYASAGTRQRVDEEAGGLDALARKREKWRASWTPAVETALVEKIVFGDTLEQVARHQLEEQLADAQGTGAAAQVLAEAVVARSPALLPHALAACEEAAVHDQDLPSLARACQVFSGLCAYGSARLHWAGEGAAPMLAMLPELCKKTFARAVLRVPDACMGNDEAVGPVLGTLKALHEIALAQPLVDAAAWFQAADGTSRSYAVNPLCAGYASGLLCQSQHLSEEEVALRVGQRLSDLLEPLPASSFLYGFFQVNTVVLSRNRAVVQALDTFLCGIAPERFRDTLPLLRRAFSQLGATERRYLLENLLGLRRIGEKQQAAKAVLAEKDKAMLKAMDQELAAAMDDLDDLL